MNYFNLINLNLSNTTDNFEKDINLLLNFIQDNCLKNGQITSFVNDMYTQTPTKIDHNIFVSGFILKTLNQVNSTKVSFTDKIYQFIEKNMNKTSLTWSYFLNDIYPHDWDTTSVCRNALRRSFDNTILKEIYATKQLVNTWLSYTNKYFKSEIDLCVNLNILEYLYFSEGYKYQSPKLLDWIKNILKSNGKKYFSSYYYLYEFLLYQLAKFYYFRILSDIEIYDLLIAELLKKRIIYNNFFAYILQINAKLMLNIRENITYDRSVVHHFVKTEQFICFDVIYWGYGWHIDNPVIASFSCPSIIASLLIEYITLYNRAENE